MSAERTSRRQFLHQSAALTVAFTIAPLASAASLPGSLQNNRMLDGWLRINPSGTVTVFTGKVELGQGITTALAQIAADELDVDLRRIEMISGDTSLTPNEGVTSGSRSIEDSGSAVRFAAAEAREILVAAAAAKLGATPADLRVEDGTITGPGRARTTYWQITGEASLKREATAAAKPKPAREHRVIGREIERRDIPAKVTGGIAYVQDLRLPGMVFGRVVRPPSPRARLLSFDEAGARAMPGVVALVRDGSFLAVAAEREEQAILAMQALRRGAQWQEAGDLPPSGPELFQRLKSARAQDMVISEKTAAAGSVAAVKTLEAQYTRPFMAHASIGPSCAVAHWQGGKMQIYTHSQGVFPLRADLAKTLGLAPSDLVVSHREGSGCYGHNGADDVALDAALLARATSGRPVKVQWMREDEFAWEPYGSAMAVRLKASLDPIGRVVDWQGEVWSYPHTTRPGEGEGVNLLAAWYLKDPHAPGPPFAIPQPAGGGDRNAIPLYLFPQQRVAHHMAKEMPIRVSALRTLGAFANVFAIESFMDELAAAAKVDPVEFRLRHLGDPRAKAVIEAVADKAWKPVKASEGRGRGIGFARYKNLAVYTAAVAEVRVDRASGTIHVDRVSAVCDAGLVINPNGFRNQIEGGIIQATSWTLREAIAYDKSHILTRAWAKYPILRFPDVPAVDVTIIDRPEEKPLGVGEGAHGPTAAAIANAVAHATGKRLRDLPLSPERVKAALG